MSYLHIHIFIAFSFFCLVFQARRHLFSFWQYAKQNFCFIGSVVSHCVKGVQIRSFFWSIFSCIRTEFGGLLRKSPYSVRIQEDTVQKKLRIWTPFTQFQYLAIVIMRCVFRSQPNIYDGSHCGKSVQIRSFFWSVCSFVQTNYGDLRSKYPYSVRIQENTDQKKLHIWTLYTQCLFPKNGKRYLAVH